MCSRATGPSLTLVMRRPSVGACRAGSSRHYAPQRCAQRTQREFGVRYIEFHGRQHLAPPPGLHFRTCRLFKTLVCTTGTTSPHHRRDNRHVRGVELVPRPQQELIVRNNAIRGIDRSPTGQTDCDGAYFPVGGTHLLGELSPRPSASDRSLVSGGMHQSYFRT